jgi:RNA-directed DNA polymerase
MAVPAEQLSALRPGVAIAAGTQTGGRGTGTPKQVTPARTSKLPACNGSRGHAQEALVWTGSTMTRLGLTLNRTKTRLCDARTERFDFPGDRAREGGYSFGLHRFRQTGRRFIGASPSSRCVQRLKEKVGAILVPRSNFLARHHKMPARGIGRLTMTAVLGELGVPRRRHCRRQGVTS